MSVIISIYVCNMMRKFDDLFNDMINDLNIELVDGQFGVLYFRY